MFDHISKHLEVRKNTPLCVVFTTLFSVFINVVKHGPSCLKLSPVLLCKAAIMFESLARVLLLSIQSSTLIKIFQEDGLRFLGLQGFETLFSNSFLIYHRNKGNHNGEGGLDTPNPVLISTDFEDCTSPFTP